MKTDDLKSLMGARSLKGTRKRGLTVVIDGDILAYKALAATQESQFDGEIIVPHHRAALEVMRRALKRIQEFLGPHRIRSFTICMSGPENYRKEVYSEYKANRKDVEKPVGYKEFVEETVYEEFKDCLAYATASSGLEADDMMGVLATQRRGPSVVCSIDKDLLQIPCYHLNPYSMEFCEVSKINGERLFFAQAMCGDSTDGYYGIPGIGLIKAFKLLRDAEEVSGARTLKAKQQVWWLRVREAYEEYWMNEECALIIAQMARILQANDFNLERRPNYWQPPKNIKRRAEWFFEWDW